MQCDPAPAGLPREKVLATVVRLLETTLIRVGNEEYARDNRSYGLTTLRTEHVRVMGPRVRFEFRGKGGKPHLLDVSDRRLARIVQQCQELPGHELFQYVDESGQRQAIDWSDINTPQAPGKCSEPSSRTSTAHCGRRAEAGAPSRERQAAGADREPRPRRGGPSPSGGAVRLRPRGAEA